MFGPFLLCFRHYRVWNSVVKGSEAIYKTVLLVFQVLDKIPYFFSERYTNLTQINPWRTNPTTPFASDVNINIVLSTTRTTSFIGYMYSIFLIILYRVIIHVSSWKESVCGSCDTSCVRHNDYVGRGWRTSSLLCTYIQLCNHTRNITSKYTYTTKGYKLHI